ncbi:MAG: hypothetical protein PHW82_00285 [Bacteroidales bacterium]|nr:hypothetical protein [Bacteroidales bacterium]
MRVVFLMILIVSMLGACIQNSVSDNKTGQQTDTIVDKKDTVSQDTDVYKVYIEDNKSEISDSIPVDEYYSDPLVVSYVQQSDTMVINENCVIFLWPDSLEIVAMQDQYPVRYLDILNDKISYVSDAAIVMDADGIKNFFCDKSVIKFINAPEDIILQRKKVEGDMLMFKYGKQPYVLDAVEFDIEQVKAFFVDKIDTLKNLN